MLLRGAGVLDLDDFSAALKDGRVSAATLASQAPLITDCAVMRQFFRSLASIFRPQLSAAGCDVNALSAALKTSAEPFATWRQAVSADLEASLRNSDPR